MAQAEALDGHLRGHGIPLDAVLYIAVPDEVLAERASGRRYCPTDGSTYHVRFAPPRLDGRCDTCGEELAQRDDDRESVVRARLREYGIKTAPLVSFYRERGVLHEVSGLGTPSEVSRRAEGIVRGLGR